MRISKLIVAAALVAGILSAFVAARPAEAGESSGATFNVDPIHSMVVFRIQHVGVSYTYGMFWEPTGSYSLDFENPSNSSLSMTLGVEKISTGNERRDNHLKSPDFFNAKQYPEITFSATAFEKGEDGAMRVTGDLTLLGQTHPVTANVRFVDENENTMQGHKSGFEADFEFDRSTFGMTKYIEGGGLGDTVSIYATVEGVIAEAE